MAMIQPCAVFFMAFLAAHSGTPADVASLEDALQAAWGNALPPARATPSSSQSPSHAPFDAEALARGVRNAMIAGGVVTEADIRAAGARPHSPHTRIPLAGGALNLLAPQVRSAVQKAGDYRATRERGSCASLAWALDRFDLAGLLRLGEHALGCDDTSDLGGEWAVELRPRALGMGATPLAAWHFTTLSETLVDTVAQAPDARVAQGMCASAAGAHTAWILSAP
jgi:hypothetical protein